MHGIIGNPEKRVPRVIRRHSDWTLKEHEVVVSFWPDTDEIAKRLPGRTRTAILHFAGKCNLRKPIHVWSAAQHSLLRRRIQEGMPIAEIAKELGLTKLQVTNRIRYTGLHCIRRSPTPTGFLLIDAIKQRAYSLNITMKELDEACRSGNQFSKWSPARRIHIKHFLKAAKVMEGEITIRWSEL